MQNQTRPTDVNCPICHAFIEVSIDTLLLQESIMCPFCLMSFTMDRSKSKEDFDTIQKLNTALENLEGTKDSHQSLASNEE